MNQIEFLELVINILKKKQKQYGSAEESFTKIASLISTYKDVEITKEDWCVFNVLEKVVRMEQAVKEGSELKIDTPVDIVGYTAILVEFLTNTKQKPKKKKRKTKERPVFCV